MTDEPQRLGASLDRVLRSLGAPGRDAVTTVFEDWPDVAGPELAPHSRPVRFERGVLVVAVSETGWATRLRYQEADLLRRLAVATGSSEISRLEIRVRPAP